MTFFILTLIQLPGILATALERFFIFGAGAMDNQTTDQPLPNYYKTNINIQS